MPESHNQPSLHELRIFLCYASDDWDAMRVVRDGLMDAGFLSWGYYRRVSSGRDWDYWQDAWDKILQADVILVFLSRASVTMTGQVEAHITFVLDVADKRPEGSIILIPVKLEECGIPDRLSHLPLVDLSETGGWDRLLLALNKCAERSNRQGTVGEKATQSAVPVNGRQQRMLDAAMPSRGQVGRATELLAMVRRTDSGGLRAILELEDDYLPIPEDVRTKSFEVDFPIDTLGKLDSAKLLIRVVADDFAPQKQKKEIVIPADGDSEVVTFQLTPQRLGKLTVHVELHATGIFLGTRVLRTNVELDDIPAPASQQYVMVSIPMVVRVQESSAVSLASTSSFAYIKRQTLKDHLQALVEEYQAANAQSSRTLSDVDRVRLERQLRDLEQKIAKIEADLAALDHPPEIAGEVSYNDPAPGQAGASPADSGEIMSGDVANASPPSPPARPVPVPDHPARLP